MLNFDLNMIKLNEEEAAQKNLEFCTRDEKYGPQLRAKFKCWNSNFPICGLTDKYFIIYRGRACITDPKLHLIFVDRMRDGSVGDGWVLANCCIRFYSSYHYLENKVTTEVLNEIGDSEKQLASRYKTDSFDLRGATDPFAPYPTVADWLAKVK